MLHEYLSKLFESYRERVIGVDHETRRRPNRCLISKRGTAKPTIGQSSSTTSAAPAFALVQPSLPPPLLPFKPKRPSGQLLHPHDIDVCKLGEGYQRAGSAGLPIHSRLSRSYRPLTCTLCRSAHLLAVGQSQIRIPGEQIDMEQFTSY
jgi:hypothetical protein